MFSNFRAVVFLQQVINPFISNECLVSIGTTLTFSLKKELIQHYWICCHYIHIVKTNLLLKNLKKCFPRTGCSLWKEYFPARYIFFLICYRGCCHKVKEYQKMASSSSRVTAEVDLKEGNLFYNYLFSSDHFEELHIVFIEVKLIINISPLT